MMLSSKAIRCLLFIGIVLLLITASCDNNLSPSQEQEGASAQITLKPIPRFADTMGKAKNLTASSEAFTCVVSTLLPDSADNNYRYNTYQVQVPDQFKHETDDSRWQTFVYGDRKAPSHAEQVAGYGGIVRMARCNIPDNKEVAQWLDQQFKKFSADSWLETNQPEEQLNNSSTAKVDTGNQTYSKIVCDSWQIASVCDGNGENCIIKAITCTSWHHEQEGPGGGGGGDDGSGGGVPGGPLPDPCTPCDPTMHCDDTGGTPIGCVVDPLPPPPTDPSEYENPPEYCTQDPCETNGTYPILDDDTVQQAMGEVWMESYGPEDNSLPHDQRNEAMFMVLVTTSGYEIEEIPPGPGTSSCHFEGEEDYGVPSNIGALIHVHPYSDGDTVDDSARGCSGVYDGDEVSDGDESIIQQISNSTILPPTPMYVIDKDKIRVIEPSDPSQYDEVISRCGY